MPTYIGGNSNGSEKYPDWSNKGDHGDDGAVQYIGGKRQSAKDGIYFSQKSSSSGSGSSNKQSKGGTKWRGHGGGGYPSHR